MVERYAPVDLLLACCDQLRVALCNVCCQLDLQSSLTDTRVQRGVRGLETTLHVRQRLDEPGWLRGGM